LKVNTGSLENARTVDILHARLIVRDQVVELPSFWKLINLGYKGFSAWFQKRQFVFNEPSAVFR